MEHLIFFNDVNLIGKDNNNVFSSYATKYFLYLIDDYSVMDKHTEFPFEKRIVYFKENKYKTGFLGDDNSETYIKLEPNGSFGWVYDIVPTKTDFGTTESAIIKMKGDWELQDTIDTLKWLLKKLEYVQQETQK